VDWNLSVEQRRALRSLLRSEGWRIYFERLKQLEAEATEYALSAPSRDEAWERRMFLEGVQQVTGLADSLLTVDEGENESWVDQQVERLARKILATGEVSQADLDRLRQQVLGQVGAGAAPQHQPIPLRT